MRTPGFLAILQDQLENLPLEILEAVNRPGGLEIRDLMDFVLRPKDYTVDAPYEVDPEHVLKNEKISIDAFWLGRDSLVEGTTAHCIIASGGAFEKMPRSDTTLLELQLMKTSWVKNVWIMVGPDRLEEAKKIVDSLGNSSRKVFTQYESFSLTPDNRLHEEEGAPLLHSCGEGDLIPALKHSGILESFIASGGRHVIVCDGDNILGSAHPVIVGQHLLAKSIVTCEVTSRKRGDEHAILCEHGGFNQVVENHRLSSHTDIEEFSLVSTGTYVFDVSLDFDSVKWKWHRTKSNLNNKLVVQYKRSLCDLTATYQTHFIETPRYFCFMPLRDYLREHQKNLQK